MSVRVHMFGALLAFSSDVVRSCQANMIGFNRVFVLQSTVHCITGSPHLTYTHDGLHPDPASYAQWK